MKNSEPRQEIEMEPAPEPTERESIPDEPTSKLKPTERESVPDNIESDMGTASDDFSRPVYADDKTSLIELQDG